MSHPQSGWILAFDDTCERCRHVSESVEAASGGRLQVRPLADPDVRRWRAGALGPDAPWAPTLIETGTPRAWTGPRLGLRLARRLGVRATVRVLRALGDLSAGTAPGGDTTRGVPRRGLFRLGAGAGAGLALMVASATPSAAGEPRKLAAARAWAAANQRSRAGQYDELVRFEPAYRKVIFADVSPAVRRRLWREQVTRFRGTHPGLTGAQARVLDEADALLAEPALFAEPDEALRRRALELETAAVEAFGASATCGLFFSLGPAYGSTGTPEPMTTCGCSVGSTCDGGGCTGGPCVRTGSGCGCFWAWACDGCYGCV